MDNKDYQSAKTVATRKNNAERKKLPLFADQLPTWTPEQILERRTAAREAARIWREKFDASTAATIEDTRARIAALVSEAEFAEIIEWVENAQLTPSNAWSIVNMKIRRRMEPLTENEELVLAWLHNQEGDVTTDELHRRCGDGMARKDLLYALLGLQDRGLVDGGLLRTCAVSGHDSAPFELTLAGREWMESA